MRPPEIPAMPRVCTICAHPDRDAIDAAIINGEPNRRIATRCVVSEAAIRRHRADHLSLRLTAAHDVQEAATADDLLTQVQHLATRALAILSAAEADGDRRIALGAIREARGCLELLGKVAGQLGADVHVQVDATVIGRLVVEDPESRRLAGELRDRVQYRDAGDVRDDREPRRGLLPSLRPTHRGPFGLPARAVSVGTRRR